MLDQRSIGVSRERTHYRDDREGATLLLIVLTAAALTLLTTSVLAGLLAIVPAVVMLAEARIE